MTQWAYTSRVILDSVFVQGSISEDNYLDDYGKRGWELCAITVDETGRRYYFKRQITENK